MSAKFLRALVFCVFAACSATVVGQQQASEQESEQSRLAVYPLKYLDVRSASELLSAFLGDSSDKTLRWDGDVRLNRLIVLGNSKSHEQFTKLLAELDTAPKSQEVFEVVKLPTPNNIDMAEIIQMVPDAKIAMTMTPQGVLLRGKADDIDRVQAVLHEVMSVSDSAPLQESRMLVELLWLTESPGLSEKALAPALAGKLKNAGFENLYVLNAMEIRTGSGGTLTATTANPEFEVAVSGSTDVVQQGIQLKLRIEANAFRSAGAKSDPTSIDVSSELLTKLDHWIIFGVANRDSPSEREAGRDLILVRVKEAVEL